MKRMEGEVSELPLLFRVKRSPAAQGFPAQVGRLSIYARFFLVRNPTIPD